MFCLMPPPYERLEAWQRSHALVLAVYRETRSWPDEERYGLISQIRRASVSAGTNLAEGSARFGGRDSGGPRTWRSSLGLVTSPRPRVPSLPDPDPGGRLRESLSRKGGFM